MLDIFGGVVIVNSLVTLGVLELERDDPFSLTLASEVVLAPKARVDFCIGLSGLKLI